MKQINSNLILAGAIVFSALMVAGAMVYSAGKNVPAVEAGIDAGNQIEKSLNPNFEGAEEAGSCGV